MQGPRMAERFHGAQKPISQHEMKEQKTQWAVRCASYKWFAMFPLTVPWSVPCHIALPDFFREWEELCDCPLTGEWKWVWRTTEGDLKFT